MDHPDPTLFARAALDAPMAKPAVRETAVLWSASEGQVSNAGVYLIAVLTFWLVLPLLYAGYRYLCTVRHRYTLTDQRLIEEHGILVKNVESVELYRVKDISVQGSLLQSVFGRGRVVIQSTDAMCRVLAKPTLGESGWRVVIVVNPCEKRPNHSRHTSPFIQLKTCLHVRQVFA